MITLHQFQRTWGLPNLSPFCIKVEAALRMAGLPYEVAPGLPGGAPQGKLPYIVDGGLRLGDSELILDHLRDRHGFDPDHALTPEQRAVSAAFRALLDDRVYWSNIHARWADERNWPVVREAIFSEIPAAARPVVSRLVRRAMLGQLRGHGLGRHSREAIYAFGAQGVRAVSDYLADKPFFHGEAPSRIDLSLAGYVINQVRAPIESPMRDAARARPNLVAYAERALWTWFPEFAEPPA